MICSRRSLALHLLLIGLALIISGCSASVLDLETSLQQASGTLEPDVVLYIEAALRAIQLSQSMGEAIWPGYRPDRFAFLFVQPGGKAYLLNHPHPPKAYQPLVTEGMSLAINLTGAATFPEGFGYLTQDGNQMYRLNGIPTMVFEVRPDQDVKDLLGFLVHEPFHAFQHESWQGISLQPNRRAVCDDPDADEDDFALIRLEDALLADSLAAEDEQDRLKALQAYITLRRWRRSTLPREAVNFENEMERLEGTATYVQKRYERDGGRLHLHDFPVFNNSISIPDIGPYLDRWRYYRVGAVLGALWDAQRWPWKRALMQGASWDDLIAKRFPAPGVQALQERAVSILNEHRNDAQLQRAREDFLKYGAFRQTLLRNFQSESGLEVRLLSSSIAPGVSFGYSGLEGVSLPGCRRLMRLGDLFLIGKDLRLQLFQTTALWKLHDEAQNFWDFRELTFHTQEITSLRLDGEIMELSPGKRTYHSSLELEAPAGSLAICGQGTVEITQASWVVTVERFCHKR